MAAVGPVIARLRAGASREAVWTYFADPELLRTWWPDAALDVVFGGAVSERWRDGDGPEAATRDAVGTVDVLIAGHALGFRWRDGSDAHETAVLITFRSHDTDAGAETDVMVTETGFGRFPDAFERTADAQQSWIDLLTGLRDVLPERAPVEAAGVALPGDAPLESDGDVGDAGEAEDPEAFEAEEPEVLEVDAEPEPEPESEAEAEASDADPELREPDVDPKPAEADPDQAAADPEPADAESESADADPESADADPGPAEPDFDSLLRGDSQPRPE